jgi:hypothetical protein
MNNEKIRAKMNIHLADCCKTCGNSRDSGHFRDRMECCKLPCSEGQDVWPWETCGIYEKREE